MRNYIYLITTFVLLFCLGCGSAENLGGNAAVEDANSNAEEVWQDGAFSAAGSEEQDLSSEQIGSSLNAEQEDDRTENNETENNKTEDEIEYVAVQTKHIFEQYVDRETGNILVDLNYHVISLEEGNETLTQTVSKWMVKRQQDLEEKGLELMVKAKEKQKETGNENLKASLWHEITLYRVDNRLISFVERQYSYSIDTWNNDYRCVNFDVESGKNLLLHDLLVDKDGFRQAVIAYCVDALENTYTNSEVGDNVAEEIYQSIIAVGNWCLDASGFVFVYEDDTMEYSNEGVLFVHIPYDVVIDYMNPEYLWGETYGIAALDYEQAGTIVVDGVENEIRVEKQYDEYYIEQSKLIYGDSVVDMGKHMRTSNIYLVSHEKWKYLAMAVDMASEDYQTYFYQLKEDGIGQVFAVDGCLDSANVRADSFHLALRIDILGTYRTYPEYFILEDGNVAAYSTDYEIKYFNYDYNELVTVRELPVVKDSENVLLPSGSRLRILSTDNKSWAKLVLLDTMEEVIVNIKRDQNYSININGISEYEYFEELPYAG